MNHGLLLGCFLLSLLLLIHFSSRRRPLSSTAPLDVDDGLPIPWAGYASSAFSLSGLFGAFLGMFLFLGWGALLGTGIGVTVSLFIIRFAITRTDPATFEEFLSTRRFCPSYHSQLLLWLFLGLLQLWFATSELIILREVAVVGLGLSPRHATAMALSVALIVYFYCLMGGYDAVFRTDILQFAALAVMCVWISVIAITNPLILSPDGTTPSTYHEYWTFGLSISPAVDFILTTIISIPIGITGLLGTPATWKRVFLSLRRSSRYNSFPILVIAGAAPFLLLSPVLWRLRNSVSQELPLDFLFGLDNSRSFSFALLIGMVSAFMSAFNSSLVAASHVFMTKPVNPGLERHLTGLGLYRGALCSGFAVVILVSLAIFNQGLNLYLVGNFMVGPFCVVGGLILGTSFLEYSMDDRVLGIISMTLIGWFVYLANLLLDLNASSEASAAQVESMPVGAALFLLATALARLTRKREQ